MIRAIRWLVVLLLALLFSVDAHAALVTTTYCIEYALTHTDNEVGDLLDGSWTNARGARIQFFDNGFPFAKVYDGYLDDSTGCATLAGADRLDSSKTYTVKMPREAVVDGNEVLVRNSTGGTYTLIAKTDLAPSANRTYSPANGDNWTSDPCSTEACQILSAAQWALHRYNVGLSGETFTIRNGACNGGTGNCFDESTEILWTAYPDRKFNTAKLIGLAMTNFKNLHVDPQVEDSADIDDCPVGASATGVLMNSREYQSEATYQGFGAFYAAATFNQDDEDADCEYSHHTIVDWNADGDFADPDEDSTVFSCEESPAPNQSPPVGWYGYFIETCYGTGELDNRGTQYDWLRFLWDYHTDDDHGGFTMPFIFGLWADADPESWNADGDVLGDGDNPYERLKDAAFVAEGEPDLGMFDFILQAQNHQVSW